MPDQIPPLTPANDVGPKAQATGNRRRRLRKWLHKITIAVAILAPLIFVVAALGYKFGVFGLGLSLMTLTLKVGPAFLALSMIFGIVTLLAAWLIKPRKGFLIGIFAIVLPAIGGAKLYQMQSTVKELPYIHDITTDTQNPPVFGATIMAERAAVEGINTADYIGKKAPVVTEDGTPAENLVSVLQTKAYPEIRPIILNDTTDVVFNKALSVATSMGWNIKEEDLEAGRIDATDTTFWYGFDDDVTIRLQKSEGGGTIVDVRSLSRIGGSDLGKNAERVGEFLERLGD